MSTNPFDMDDLLGAYALDAVDDDERRAVEDYLAANPRARAEVQQHREVATMLAWSGMDAPEGLWDRIVDSLDAHEERPDASSLGKVLPLASPRRRRMARTVGYWVAATAAAAIIAIVAVSALRTNDPATLDKVSAQAFANPALLHSQLSSGSNSSLKVLAVIDRNGTGYLRADSLQQNLNAPRLGSKLDRIREQNPDHLLQPVRIAEHGARGVEPRLEMDLLGLGRRPNGLHRRLDNGDQIDQRANIETHFAGGDPRHVQQILNELYLRPDAARNAGETALQIHRILGP